MSKLEFNVQVFPRSTYELFPLPVGPIITFNPDGSAPLQKIVNVSLSLSVLSLQDNIDSYFESNYFECERLKRGLSKKNQWWYLL